MTKGRKIMLAIGILCVLCIFVPDGAVAAGIGVVLIIIALLSAPKKAEPVPRSEATPAATPAATTTAVKSIGKKDLVFEIKRDGNVYERRYTYDKVALDMGESSSQQIGAAVNLVPEHDNQDDAEAVAAYADEIKLGYLPRNRMQGMVRDFVARQEPVVAYVDGSDPLSLLIAFYRRAPNAEELERSQRDRKDFTLIGNANEEMQDEISYTEEGERLRVYYDIGADKYIVGDVGYLPKSADAFLEDVDDRDVSAIVKRIYDRGEKKAVTVTVYTA